MRADDGPRPDPKIAGTCGKSGTYQPMRKKGAIILATGGDNSNSAMGKPLGRPRRMRALAVRVGTLMKSIFLVRAGLQRTWRRKQ